jgi:hypothetical protein
MTRNHARRSPTRARLAQILDLFGDAQPHKVTKGATNSLLGDHFGV